MKLLTTSELASLFSISKHTIRHYIDIELLTPKERKENGYFFFDEENVYKLYQILVFKNICYNQFVASYIRLIVVAARGAAIVLEE